MKKRVEEIIVAVVVVGVFVLMLGTLLEGYRYITGMNNDEKKNAFLQSNQEFVCRSGFERFLVSRESGWSINRSEFVKDDKFVSISECRERD